MPIGPEVVTTDEADVSDAALDHDAERRGHAVGAYLADDRRHPERDRVLLLFHPAAARRCHRHRNAGRRRLRPAAPGLAAAGRHHRGLRRRNRRRSATGSSPRTRTSATGSGGRRDRRRSASDRRVRPAATEGNSTPAMEATRMFRATSTAAGAAVSTGRPAQRATAARGGRVLAVIAAIALGTGLAACGSAAGHRPGAAASPPASRSSSLTSRRSAGPTRPSARSTWSHATAPRRRSTRPAAYSATRCSCTTADTRGDPADAVPAVGSLLSRTHNLELVIGCTSDEAAAVVPIINSHKTVMFCMTGQSEFDSVHYDYFYRLVPPDLAESYAMTVSRRTSATRRSRWPSATTSARRRSCSRRSPPSRRPA